MNKIDVQKIDDFTGHTGSVYTIAPGPGASSFFSAGGDGRVVQWELFSPDLGTQLLQLSNPSYRLHFTNNEPALWVGENYQGLRKVAFQAGVMEASIRLNPSAVYAIESYRNRLFAGSGDGVITVLDTHEMAFVKHLKASSKSVRALAVCPEKQQLAAGYSDNYIRLFDLTNYQLLAEWQGHTASVFGLLYLPGGPLISVSRDAHLMSWSTDGQILSRIPAHMQSIHSVAFNAHANLLATGSMDKTIKLWDPHTLKLLKVIDHSRYGGHRSCVNQVLWLNPTTLLTASDDRTIIAWKITKQKTDI